MHWKCYLNVDFNGTMVYYYLVSLPTKYADAWLMVARSLLTPVVDFCHHESMNPIQIGLEVLPHGTDSEIIIFLFILQFRQLTLPRKHGVLMMLDTRAW